MPELPEVETTLRGLRPLWVGKKLMRVDVRAKQLRFPFPPRFAKRLTGATITNMERRAKYILAGLDTGEALLVHLGMSGRLIQVPRSHPMGKHDHVIFFTDDGKEFRFNDPRRFGILDIVKLAERDNHKLLSAIGPEPLGKDLTPAHLLAAFANKKAPVKNLLLDQRIVAGLGNIYVSEALFYAGIRPDRGGAKVKKAEVGKLVPAIRQVLEASIKAGGTSMRDYVQATGELGWFQTQFAVYNRDGEPCLKCGHTVRKIVQSGRSSYYCPHCQR